MTDDQEEPIERTTEDEPAPLPRVPSETVGTGSYIAVSCSVVAILVTVLLIAGLLIVRWLT